LTGFSEDIDLALDRKFLGFGDNTNPTRAKRLRKDSYSYISSALFPLTAKILKTLVFHEAELKTQRNISMTRTVDYLK